MMNSRRNWPVDKKVTMYMGEEILTDAWKMERPQHTSHLHCSMNLLNLIRSKDPGPNNINDRDVGSYVCLQFLM